MLGSREQVTPRLRRRLQVLQPGALDVREGCVSAPVLCRGVGKDNLRHRVKLAKASKQAVGLLGQRIRKRVVRERELVPEPWVGLARGLGESVVELAHAPAGHVRQQAVEYARCGHFGQDSSPR